MNTEGKLNIAIQTLKKISESKPEEIQNNPTVECYCDGCKLLIAFANNTLIELEEYK